MRRNAPLVQAGDKYCFRCATAKPVGEFYAVPSKPDGRDSRCKPCAREASRQSQATRKRLDALYQFFKDRKGTSGIDLGSLEPLDFAHNSEAP
jgi:hypothetical protein